MRSSQLLTGTALLGGLAGALVLSMLALRSGEPREALALLPTPAAWGFDWSVDLDSDPVAGHTLKLSAVATPVNTIGNSGGSINDPVYSLIVTDPGDTELELTSSADVPVSDIADGASWELRGQGEGEATVELRVDYTLSYCLISQPCASHHASGYTTETVTVAGPPPNGDVNGDGETNSIDALLILQFTAGIILPPPPNSDVNLDGVANSVDAMLILQYSARLISSLQQPSIPAIPGEPTFTPSGLGIYDIKVGTGAEVQAGDTITVNYIGWLTNGATFDASLDHGGATQLSLNGVIPGWQEGVPGMRVGGTRRLIIPPNLAYGDQGCCDVIPPNATLIFDIELVSIA